jgi:hypothetical protein
MDLPFLPREEAAGGASSATPTHDVRPGRADAARSGRLLGWVRAHLPLRLLALATLGASAVTSASSTVHAENGGTVQVGEVSTIVGHTEVVPAMKATLSSELSKVKPPAGHSYVVSANLVKLELVKGTSRKQAVISLALRDAQGNLKGVIQGTASGERASDREIVEAAAKGGTKAVAEFVTK